MKEITGLKKGYPTSLRVIAFLTLFTFSLTSGAQAQPVSSVSNGSGQSISASLITDRIIIPERLGDVQAQFKASNDAPLVILIQDAHTILDAQLNIQKIIDYLQNKYGIDLVALEGGKGPLDATLFRSFPDELLKKKVLMQYLERGEISGAEMAAIFDQKESTYYGIEDWNLYQENYLAYIDAMQTKEKFLTQINFLKEILDKEKERIYSPELKEFHKHIEAFQEEGSRLVELLTYLSSFTKGRETEIKELYPHLMPVIGSLDRESSFQSKSLESQVQKIAESFKEKCFLRLDPKRQMEFNGQYQDFLTTRIDSGIFLKYVIHVATSIGVKPKLNRSLRELLEHTQTLSTIKGTRLFEELESFLHEIEGKLIRTSAEKDLAGKYNKIRRLKKLANLELTEGELREYQKAQGEYLQLLGEDMVRSLADPALAFYSAALKRDQIFQKNLNRLLRKRKAKAAIVLAGGFHAQGLQESLRRQGFSYVVISPKIHSLEGQEHYGEVMQGNLSYQKYLETTFYDAFVKDATLKLVDQLDEPAFRKNIKLWRDEVIRRLASEGRISQAGRYTRYIDLLFKAYYDKFGKAESSISKGEVLANIQKELDQFQDDIVNRLWQRVQFQFQTLDHGLRELIEKKSLNSENVSSLLHRMNQTTPFTLKPVGPLYPNLPVLPTMKRKSARRVHSASFISRSEVMAEKSSEPVIGNLEDLLRLLKTKNVIDDTDATAIAVNPDAFFQENPEKANKITSINISIQGEVAPLSGTVEYLAGFFISQESINEAVPIQLLARSEVRSQKKWLFIGGGLAAGIGIIVTTLVLSLKKPEEVGQPVERPGIEKKIEIPKEEIPIPEKAGVDPLSRPLIAQTYQDVLKSALALRAANGIPYNQTPGAFVPRGGWIKANDPGAALIADMLAALNHSGHPIDKQSDPKVVRERINRTLKTLERMVDTFELKIDRKDGKGRQGTGILPEVLVREGNFFNTELTPIPGKGDQKGIAFASFDWMLTLQDLKIVRDISAGNIVPGLQDDENAKIADRILNRVTLQPFVNPPGRLQRRLFLIPETGEIIFTSDFVDRKDTEARAILSVLDLFGQSREPQKTRIEQGKAVWNKMSMDYTKLPAGDRLLPIARGDLSGWTQYYGAPYFDFQEIAPNSLGKSNRNYFLVARHAGDKEGHKIYVTAPGTGKKAGTYFPHAIGAEVTVPVGPTLALTTGLPEAIQNMETQISLAQKQPGTYVPGWGLPDAIDPKTGGRFPGNDVRIYMNQVEIAKGIGYQELRKVVQKTSIYPLVSEALQDLDKNYPAPAEEKVADVAKQPDLNLLQKIKGAVGIFTHVDSYPGNSGRYNRESGKIEIQYKLDAKNQFGGFYAPVDGADISNYNKLRIRFGTKGTLPRKFKIEFKEADNKIVGAPILTPEGLKAGQTIDIDISITARAAQGKKVEQLTLVFELEASGANPTGNFTIEELTLISSSPRSEVRMNSAEVSHRSEVRVLHRVYSFLAKKGQALKDTIERRGWDTKIPFYRFVSTKASFKASLIVTIAGLMTIVAGTIGGYITWDELRHHAYGTAAYAFLITIMILSAVVGVAELLLVQTIMFFQSKENAGKPLEPVADEALPTVTVLIPVRNEPVEVVKETLASVMSLDYPVGKLKIMVVDNTDTIDKQGQSFAGNNYEKLKEYIETSSGIATYRSKRGENSVALIHREGTAGYKSGNLNLGFSNTDSQYILQLDADSLVQPDTLRVIMPEFVHHETDRKEGEPHLAYVQIALSVHNKNENLLTWTLATLHAIVELFWRPIRKNYRFVSSFGHHFIVSKEAVQDAGGFPVDIGLGEDTDLAVGIQITLTPEGKRKWIGKRVDYHRLDEGVPNTFEGLKVQRWRWVFGNARIFIKRFNDIRRSPLQWYEKYSLLFDLGIFFLSAVLIVTSILTPLVLLLSPVAYPKELVLVIMVTWMAAYGVTYVASLNYLKRGDEKGALDTILSFFTSLTVGFALIPTILHGAFQALFRKSAPFKVTPKGMGENTRIRDIIRLNKSEIILGIYFLAFIPFVPVTFGYTIPALIMGLSLILWPFHLKLYSWYQNLKERFHRIWNGASGFFSRKGFIFSFGEEGRIRTSTLIIWAGIIAIGAAFVRFYQLDYLGPWMDEATYINAGRDALNPDRNWGWINGWKYAFPPVAAFGDWLFGSFVGARVMTAALGMGTLLFTYFYSKHAISDLTNNQENQNLNRWRALASIAALSIAIPLVMTSRLATYDTLAYFLLALSLFLIQRVSKLNGIKSYFLGAIAIVLAVMSKYVVLIFIPFIISYALIVKKDISTWQRKFLVPLTLGLGLFIAFNLSEILVGVSLTGRGYWVDRSILGVLAEVVFLISPFLLLLGIGLSKIPKENRPRAWWILGGALFLIAYHIYDRHIQALAKGLSAFLIIIAPLIGIGLSKLWTLRIHTKKLWNYAAILFLTGVLAFTAYFVPERRMGFWEDLYGPVQVIQTYSTKVENPSIYTTRPHELILLVPELTDHVNRGQDMNMVPDRLKQYANTRYVVDGNDVVLNVLMEKYDIVHLTPEWWNAVDPESLSYIRKMRAALWAKGYREIYYDGDEQIGKQTPWGTIRKPSGSHVLVAPRILSAMGLRTSRPSPPIEVAPEGINENAFKKAQNDSQAMKEFVRAYLMKQGIYAADSAWINGFSMWYLKPEIKGSLAKDTRSFIEFEREIFELEMKGHFDGWIRPLTQENLDFITAQRNQGHLENFLRNYLDKRGYSVVNEAWLDGFVIWYLSPDVPGSRVGVTRPFNEFEQDIQGNLDRWVREGAIKKLNRSELRKIQEKRVIDLTALLPSAIQIAAQIREKETLESTIKIWEVGARKRLEIKVRQEITNRINHIIAQRANNFQRVEDFTNWLFTSDFEKDVRSSLKSFVIVEDIETVDVQALIWRIRGVVIGETISAIDQVDLKLTQQAFRIDNIKIITFQNRLDRAIASLKSTYQGQKLILAINYSDTEVGREVLGKFSDLIDRIEILLERTQQLKRSDWQGFRFSAEIVDPANPGRAIGNVSKRGFGEEPSYALTNDILPADLLRNLNAIRAEIRKIPDVRVQKMALEASYLLLFKLAELPKARRSELRKAEALRSFIEQDQNLRFLANGFGIGQDGTVGLLAAGFLSDIAAVQQTQRAA